MRYEDAAAAGDQPKNARCEQPVADANDRQMPEALSRSAGGGSCDRLIAYRNRSNARIERRRGNTCLHKIPSKGATPAMAACLRHTGSLDVSTVHGDRRDQEPT